MKLLTRLTQAMEDENVSEVRALLMAAPLGYTPEQHSQEAITTESEKREAQDSSDSTLQDSTQNDEGKPKTISNTDELIT